MGQIIWSGYKERPSTLVDHEFVDSYFPNRADYIEFVRDYLLD